MSFKEYVKTGMMLLGGLVAAAIGWAILLYFGILLYCYVT